MRVSLQEICKFASATPASRNFTGGENIIDRGHLLNCGKVNHSDDSDVYHILGFCLQTAGLRNEPHEINGQISKNGKIIGMECSCKAGLGSTCKHIVAVLLFCNRNNLEDFKDITCTDKKCAWNAPYKSALEKYEAKPLFEHKCFEGKQKKMKIKLK
ncbi:uncharacterized protein LOC141536847 isoform X2 [Cotesia typhae]|uniref:uncharacterized protein LOC141536847 isoform X2 n=1 Tax=Cotesia typhae TaxID=2053667 RepID=UPI003D6819E3